MIHTTETRHIPVWDMVIYTTNANGEPREINLRACSWEANHLGHLLIQEVITHRKDGLRPVISSYAGWTEWHVEPGPEVLDVVFDVVSESDEAPTEPPPAEANSADSHEQFQQSSEYTDALYDWAIDQGHPLGQKAAERLRWENLAHAAFQQTPEYADRHAAWEGDQ